MCFSHIPPNMPRPSLHSALSTLVATTDFALKRRDVEHLLFRRETASRVTDFPLFLQTF